MRDATPFWRGVWAGKSAKKAEDYAPRKPQFFVGARAGNVEITTFYYHPRIYTSGPPAAPGSRRDGRGDDGRGWGLCRVENLHIC